MQSGGQSGNQNAANGKKWRAAIDRALNNRSRIAQREALDDLAEKLLARCDDMDVKALKELGDRLDGKAGQALELTGGSGGAVRFIIEK